MPFTFTRFAIPEVVLVRPKAFGDARGFFMETYRWSEFEAAGIACRFVQDNLSRSARHVLRGLHYQAPPKQQGKLVQCVRGEIFDVAVDIRPGSPSFRRHVTAILSGEGQELLYIPPGFAHGFVVVSETADVVYKCTEEYSPAHDRGIIWNDPDLGIPWPVGEPVLSQKDARLPRLAQESSRSS